jgi:hypothetical protein
LPRFSQGSEFGVDRIGKRELLLRRGEVIRRALQKPIALSNIGDTCFISFIAQRVADPSDATITNADSSFRLLLDASSTEPRHQPRPIAGVGVSTGGLPFASAGGRVRTAGGPIDASEPVLCVLRVQTLERDLRVDARFYRRGETVDRLQTSTWTISASDERPTAQISMIRLATGASAAWRIDELRVGRSWNSVITPPK